MEEQIGGRTEARRAPRFPLEQIVAVKSVDGRFEDTSGMSRDVSACGIFFWADSALPLGAHLELFMMMPPTAPVMEGLFPLRCMGSVVRVVREDDRRFGVGVKFENVEIVANA